jgi:hypothetical protein
LPGIDPDKGKTAKFQGFWRFLGDLQEMAAPKA